MEKSADVIIAELAWRRTQLALAKTETERVTFQLMIDELLEQLNRLNAIALRAKLS